MNHNRMKRQLTVTETVPDIAGIARALAAPFEAEEISWKPAAVSGSRALALPYLNARAVMDRLDEVFGVAGWRDEYEDLPSGSVVCTLSVRVAGDWIAKSDIGSPSEQPDEGDRIKAAFSDALKRVAVKFGVGRYLYRVPKQWCDCETMDRGGKQVFKGWKSEPRLPATALPAAPAKATNGKPCTNGTPTAIPVNPTSTNGTPTNGIGSDFKKRRASFDARLVEAGLCRPGDCYKRVQHQVSEPGANFDPAAWDEKQQAVALALARQFEAECRNRQP